MCAFHPRVNSLKHESFRGFSIQNHFRDNVTGSTSPIEVDRLDCRVLGVVGRKNWLRLRLMMDSTFSLYSHVLGHFGIFALANPPSPLGFRWVGCPKLSRMTPKELNNTSYFRFAHNG